MRLNYVNNMKNILKNQNNNYNKNKYSMKIRLIIISKIHKY